MIDKSIIKSVLLDNQSNVRNYDVTPREFAFDEFMNYVFVGIRRAGKSFLLYERMRQLLSQGIGWDEMLYINFEDERLSGMSVLDLNLLLEVHLEMYGKRPTLFLDEIQNIEGWEKFARRLADSKYRVYITGSNAKMLSADIQTTLGGRYIAIDVYPYDFKEFLTDRGVVLTKESLFATDTRAEILRHFNSYFEFGGLPEVAKLKVKRDYLTSVYQKIYLGDIATRNSVENTYALRVLFKKLAESVMQPVSYTRLANIIASTGVKVGKNTVINYIQYAREAWLITPITNIAGKMVDKETMPKYYFTDNGILNLFLLEAKSSLLENLVAITLLRKYGREDAVFFYNKGIEVDFYVPECFTAIQACYTLDGSDGTFEREVSALVKLSTVVECKRLMIITRDDERTIERSNLKIEIVSIWKWLSFSEI